MSRFLHVFGKNSGLLEIFKRYLDYILQMVINRVKQMVT